MQQHAVVIMHPWSDSGHIAAHNCIKKILLMTSFEMFGEGVSNNNNTTCVVSDIGQDGENKNKKRKKINK